MSDVASIRVTFAMYTHSPYGRLHTVPKNMHTRGLTSTDQLIDTGAVRNSSLIPLTSGRTQKFFGGRGRGDQAKIPKLDGRRGGRAKSPPAEFLFLLHDIFPLN